MRAWAVWTAVTGGLVQAACGGAGMHASALSLGDAASWRYDVVLGAGSRELAVDAWLPRGSLADLVVRHGAERFVRDAQIEEDDGWRDLPRRTSGVHAPQCARGCHLRYRFLLRDAAAELHDTDTAVAWGDVVEASPSMWLLHPTLAPAGTRYRFRVRTPAGSTFVTGIFEADQGRPGTFEAEASGIGVAPYAAFGPMRVRHVEAVQGATLDVAIAPAAFAVGDDALVEWVAHSARTMARFLGCFPLERVMVLVVPAEGSEVHHGETMGIGGASIVVEVGERADEAALARDWVLPHEMAHLAVPSVSRRHHWMEEGVAVYIQPIARARAGELRAEDVWRQFAAGMPKGASARGSLGLDGSSSWARMYWGGATFCLLADLEIRRRTGNRLGFEDALRGVLVSGGSIAQMWEFDRLLETADASIGGPVLRPMHDEIGREAWSVDLPSLFHELGVVVHGDEVTLIDAPLAPMRRAITEALPAGAIPPTACRWAAPGRMAQR
jgi:hypothetical protein